MITGETISKFYEDIKRLDLKRPVSTISKETGFSKGQVSDYLSRKKEPSKNFIDRFYERFKESLQNVPHETPKPVLIVAEGNAEVKYFERLISEKAALVEQIEARRRETEERMKRAEKQTDELMQVIKENLTALLLSSAKNQEYLIKIYDEQTSDDLVMMNNDDKVAGNPKGTSAEISGNYQAKLATARREAQRKSEKGRQQKAGK